MTNVDNKGKRAGKRRQSQLRVDPFFTLAVARGGSYLVSTINAQGRARQLRETVDDFVCEFDAEDLDFFLEELEGWLASRGHAEGVATVAYYRTHGAPPPVPEPPVKPMRARTRTTRNPEVVSEETSFAAVA